MIGIDDVPFDRAHRGDVRFVATVFAGSRLDGVMVGKVRRDGVNATDRVAALVRDSAFHEHAQLVMTDGIALAGFNVLDLDRLHTLVDRPILVVARRAPNLPRIRRALRHVPGGDTKWARIERAGAMDEVEGVFVQRRGLSLAEAGQALRRHRVQGKLPEPIRVAHLIGSALVRGSSHGRA